MADLYTRVGEAAGSLASRLSVGPQAAMILGTGLGGLANRLESSGHIPYSEIPHFPTCTVESHGGRLVFGELGGWNVVAMEGRFHFYEGYCMTEVTLPVRIFRELGCRFLFIASAAGGLNPIFTAGDVMLIEDHINLIPANPLRGVTDERLGERFPDMTRSYDAEMLRIAGGVALKLGMSVQTGVYAAVSGPSLETPAETRMLQILGADAVGMSTAPEVIVATQVGLRTLALTAITNVNIPDRMEPISVDEVIATASVAGPKIADLIEGTLRRLNQE